MQQFSWYQRLVAKYGGSVIMNHVSDRLKKKYNIVHEREELYELMDEYIQSIKNQYPVDIDKTGDVNNKKQKFHGGSIPDSADLAVFAVIRSVEGLRTFNDLVTHNSQIGRWYEDVKAEFGSFGNNKLEKKLS